MLFTKNILLVDDNSSDVLKFKSALNKIDNRIIINDFATINEATNYAASDSVCQPDVIFIHSRVCEEASLKLVKKSKADDTEENISIQFVGPTPPKPYQAVAEKYNTCIFSLADGTDTDIENIIASGLKTAKGYW
jgi:response regulator RpfG family c-di-GMP phosphodiesterase